LSKTFVIIARTAVEPTTQSEEDVRGYPKAIAATSETSSGKGLSSYYLAIRLLPPSEWFSIAIDEIREVATSKRYIYCRKSILLYLL
jgi:hypothetical protein